MPLAIDYDPDPQVDVLRITTEQRAWAGWHPDDDMNLAVKVGENHNSVQGAKYPYIKECMVSVASSEII